MHGVHNTGLPEGKQPGIPDNGVAIEKNCELYAPVAGWGLKYSCLRDMLFFLNNLGASLIQQGLPFEVL